MSLHLSNNSNLPWNIWFICFNRFNRYINCNTILRDGWNVHDCIVMNIDFKQYKYNMYSQYNIV
jgi:hypothetical protein